LIRYGVIGGGWLNSISTSVGGVASGKSNLVAAPYGFVGGGLTNTCSAYMASILGGEGNSATWTAK
jgi:hypothetical protein